MRKMRNAIRSTAVMTAVLVIGTLGLSGCSKDSEPEPSATPTVLAPQDKATLGAGLAKALYGTPKASDDNGACFVTAVREANLSPEAEAEIVELNSDDWGSLITDLRTNVGDEDADLLLSKTVRTKIDACINTQFGSDKDVEATKSASPAAVENKAGTANTTPVYTFDPNVSINMANDIGPGLISMLSSFGGPEDSALVTNTSECLITTVFDAGFSQAGLHFIAGGPKLTHGFVADYLPTDADKQLWASPAFLLKLSNCTTVPNKDSDDGEGK